MPAIVHTGRACAGFTLAEVLVALLVVALGIAGAAGVQAMAMRSGREAAHIADGVQLANSLAERMRANPVAMALPDSANPYLQLDYDSAAGSPPEADACFGDSNCGAAALAGFDLTEVAHELALRFPGGRLRACRDAAMPDASGLPSWTCDQQPGAPLMIKLGWREPGEAAALPRVQLAVAVGGT
jgi:type IV pilus assembly protein PilV